MHHGLTIPHGADTLFKGGWIGVIHEYPVEMAQNFWTAIYAFSASVILTVGLTFATKQKKSDEELKGLVYSLTPRENVYVAEWYNKPVVLASIVGIVCIVLTILFW